MKDKRTVLNLLTKLSNEHKNISWKMKCTFSDGIGTTINQIDIVSLTDNRIMGVFTYNVETGKVIVCTYKNLKKPKSENIVDLLLDLINYSKEQISN